MPGQLLLDDHHRQAGRGHVLLRPGEDDAVLGHVHRAGEDVGGHVAHDGHAARLGDVLPLGAVDGVVGAVIEIAGLRVQLQLTLLGNVGVVFVGGGCGQMDLAVLLRLLVGDVGEVAGHGVVGLAGGPDEVQGRHGELGGGAALEEEDLVSLQHVEQGAQLGLGVVKDLLEHLGAVTHLHDGHAGALVVCDLGSCPLQYLQRQHGRAGGKVVNTFVSHDRWPPRYSNLK